MDLSLIQDFLIDLKFNNNRHWFEEHKNRYQLALNTFENFISEIIEGIQSFDSSLNTDAKESIFRIYRDVRFSQNKEPYKTNFGAYMARDGRKSAFAGYYLHFEPDHHFLGGGIYRPDAMILKAIRTKIFEDSATFKKIINDKEFKNTFHLSEEGKLKSSPKYFPSDFQDIDLLNYKHYVGIHEIHNDFWLQSDVVNQTTAIFKKLYAFNQFINEIVEEEN